MAEISPLRRGMIEDMTCIRRQAIPNRRQNARLRRRPAPRARVADRLVVGFRPGWLTDVRPTTRAG
jgi:hypothetical protein